MSRVVHKVWRPTGEVHEVAGGLVNGWEEVGIIDVTD